MTGGFEDSVAKLDALSRRTKIDVKELSEPVEALENRWEVMRVIFDAIDGLTTGLSLEDFYNREKIRIHLKRKVDNICEDLKILFEFADFDFVNQISPQLEIEIFGPVIYSILYNLLSNSIKVLKNQKKKDTHGNQIMIRTRFDKKSLIIVFADNSTQGIPRERWDTVFNERISTTTKNKILPGHGLGLYIMKKILGYQGGSAEIVEPILGNGTTFVIRLPQKVVVKN
jgi:signal transduction histidine kinase